MWTLAARFDFAMHYAGMLLQESSPPNQMSTVMGWSFLELLTGRVPVDTKRGPGEHVLVSWVSLFFVQFLHMHLFGSNPFPFQQALTSNSAVLLLILAKNET